MKTITTILLTFCVSLLMNAQDFDLEMVKDINPNGDSNPINLKAMDDYLFFAAYDGNALQLIKTDGTEAGTEVIPEANNGGAQLEDIGSQMAILNGEIYMGLSHEFDGFELWKTDGNTFEEVKNIENPTGMGSGSGISDLTTYNGKVYFAADDGTNGKELWVTDGTSAGTQMLKDINPNGGGSYPAYFTEYNGKLYFSADDGTNGYEPWVTDGTSAGTQMLKDINPNGGGSYPAYFTEYNGKLYFSADDGTNGYEPWVTDGTSAGTQMLKDINPNGDSWLYGFTEYNGKLYFSADDGTNGKELWITDGTSAGTQMLKDINPNGSSYPEHLAEYNGKLYFVANDGTNGYQLWETDGSAENTQMLQPNIAPNNNPLYDTNFIPPKLVVFDESLYFSANYDNKGRELWKLTTQNMSVEKPEESKISLYPNPVVNELHLSAQEPVNTVNIVDITGKTVYQGQPLSQEVSIDVSMLPSSIYFVQITTDNHTQSVKIIKH